VHVVGLTGGVGSGKSTVGRMLAEAGFPVIDTDRVGHEVLERPAVLARVAAALGQDVTDAAGKPDRKKIGDIVFADPDRRAALEEILHPEIQLEVMRRIAGDPPNAASCFVTGPENSPNAASCLVTGPEVVSAGAAVVVLEVPLLVEAGWHRLVDLVVVVDCPPEAQVARYAARTGTSSDDGRGRVAAQAGRERRLAAADVVIDNSGPLEDLGRQVDALIARLKGLARDGS